MAATFQYTPLDDPAQEIRLLRFAPSDHMSCNVSVHRRQDAPRYHAISYTWGDASPTHDIRVDGKPFTVRGNCLCALRQARRHLPEGTYIWLDAICIDQSNLDEKGSQVAIMGQLYCDASAVFISIGEHHDDSDFLFEMAAHFAKTMGRPYYETTFDGLAHGLEILEHWVRPYRSWANLAREVDLVRLGRAYEDFVQRPYWRRMWIIQETRRAAAVQVACGCSCADLQHLLPIEAVLYTADAHIKRDALPEHARKLKQYGHEMGKMDDYFKRLFPGHQAVGYRFQTDAEPLSNFSESLEVYQCAAIHDRIYGILGLVDWGERGPPTPDYRIGPSVLALDVVERVAVGRQLDNFCVISGVLRALGVESMGGEDLDTPSALEGELDADLPPPWCNCVLPTSPQTTIVDNFFIHELFISREGSESPRKDASPVVGPWQNVPLDDDDNGSSGPDMSPTADGQENPLMDEDTETLVADMSPASELQEDPLGNEDTTSACLQISPAAEPQEDSLTDEDFMSSWTDTSAMPESLMEEQRRLREEEDRLYWQARREELDLATKYDLRDGDIFVTLLESPPPQQWRFCLILRQTYGRYYEILDEAVRVPIRFPSAGGALHNAELGPNFCLCLDPKDAMSIALSLHRLQARLCNGELVEAEKHSLRHGSFPRKRMSSYAVRNHMTEATRIAGAFSADGKTLPCVECGGLFKPKVVKREWYEPGGGWSVHKRRFFELVG